MSNDLAKICHSLHFQRKGPIFKGHRTTRRGRGNERSRKQRRCQGRHLYKGIMVTRGVRVLQVTREYSRSTRINNAILRGRRRHHILFLSDKKGGGPTGQRGNRRNNVVNRGRQPRRNSGRRHHARTPSDKGNICRPLKGDKGSVRVPRDARRYRRAG